jgi:hypothetical protein
MSNRRTTTRQKSFLQGRIIFNNRRSSVDCLIRDIGEDGARLKISDTITLPEAVDLYLPAKDETHRARIRWRHNGEIGVVFVLDGASSPSLAPGEPVVDFATRLQRLETDVAELQRSIRDLKQERRHRQGEE